jgi:pimeloyl-ACP methyl ester carboxylesterase
MMTKRLGWSGVVMFVVAGGLLTSGLASAPKDLAPPAFTPTRFTVVDEGRTGKPDVVLVPGLTSSREIWAGEAKLLAQNYRLHLMQMNGFGGQPAGPNATGEILPAIVEQRHAYCESLVTKPVVIGHSLGGLLTLMLAAKYPGDVRKMVIVDAFPFLGQTFGTQSTPQAIKPQAERFRSMLEQMTPEQWDANAKGTAAKLALNPEGRQIVEKDSQRSDAHVVGEAMFEDLQTDLRADLPRVKVPALMLYPFDPTLKPGGWVHSQ